MKPAANGKPGFTLIELLTVIAIIAVLAAILFPVFSTVRKKTRETQCMTQMHDIYVSLKQYEQDNNKFPAALLGFVQYQEPDGSIDFTPTATPVTIDQLKYRPLKGDQKYQKDKDVFLCPTSNNIDPNATAPGAVYPPTAGITLRNQPAFFTQAIAHLVGEDRLSQVFTPITFYAYDSYDVGPQVGMDGNAVKGNGGQPVMEVHYSLDWTAAQGSPDSPDAWNQLKYGSRAPEDKTVVTWCTYHVAIAHSNIIPVLLLNGTVKPVPLDQYVQKGPLNFAQ